MGAISSIHIGNSSVSAVIHNERYFPIDYAIDGEERNEYLTLANTAQAMREAKLDYESTLRRTTIEKDGLKIVRTTYKKLPKNTELVKEAIVNIGEHHTIEDLKLISDYLEKDFGYKICHLAIHKDEGHIENGEKIFNYHAHILMVNYDFENHRTVRPSPGQMRKMQSEVATLLKMERGKQFINPEKAGGDRLIEYQKNPKNFTTEKKKRLGTWEYKRMMAEQSENVKNLNYQNKILEEKMEADKVLINELARAVDMIKKSDLKIYSIKSLIPHIKTEFEKIRKKMAETQGHSKEDYAELRKESDNIIEELKTNKASLKDTEIALKTKISDLETRLSTAPKKELVEALTEENQTLSKDLDRMDSLYGQIEGAIEEGATNQELKELLGTHEPYKPKRSTYQTAKERSQNAYRSKLGKPPLQPKPKATLKDAVQELKNKGYIQETKLFEKQEEGTPTQTYRPRQG